MSLIDDDVHAQLASELNAAGPKVAGGRRKSPSRSKDKSKKSKSKSRSRSRSKSKGKKKSHRKRN